MSTGVAVEENDEEANESNSNRNEFVSAWLIDENGYQSEYRDVQQMDMPINEQPIDQQSGFDDDIDTDGYGIVN